MKISHLSFVFALFTAAVFAEGSPKYKQLLSMDLGEMLKVKVATGTAKQLSEAPAVVSVITAADIQATGAKTLAEAVERVPGLHVMASDNRLQNNFVIRGIQTSTTPQILVLMDGTEISDLTSWSTPVAFHYPTNFIERIEIIRGPGSAVYGADAFSGVINIITKQAKGENKLVAGGKLGSFDYREVFVNADFSIGDLKLALSITHEKQGNDSDRVTPYGVLDRKRDMDNIHLNLSYSDFTFNNWYWRVDQKMGVGASLVGNNLDRDKSEAWKSKLEWSTNLSNELSSTVDVSYLLNRNDAYFQLFPPGTWPVGADGNLFGAPFTPVSFPHGVIGNPRGDTEKIKLGSSFVYTGYNKHRLRLGVGLSYEELNNLKETKNFGPGVLDENNFPDDFISGNLVDVSGTEFIFSPDYDRDLWFVSIQDEWKFAEKWELTAGIRYDSYSDFGSTTNPRLALVWNTSDILTSKLLFGTAFRAPKVAELAYINNPAALGNPNIEAEKNETLELVFDYRPTRDFTGQLNIFKYKSKELIFLDEMGIYQNIGEQDGEGVELEVSWQATVQLQINTNLSYLYSRLPLINKTKGLVPGFMSYVDVRFQIDERWHVTSQLYWVTDRSRQEGDMRQKVSDYNKLDLITRFQASDDWNLQLGVKNLFDNDIVEPSPNSALFGTGLGFSGDYPMEGRSVFGEITVKF